MCRPCVEDRRFNLIFFPPTFPVRKTSSKKRETRKIARKLRPRCRTTRRSVSMALDFSSYFSGWRRISVKKIALVSSLGYSKTIFQSISSTYVAGNTPVAPFSSPSHQPSDFLLCTCMTSPVILLSVKIRCDKEKKNRS